MMGNVWLMSDLGIGFEVFNRLFKSWQGTSWQMSTPTANFLAGGLASNMYWFTALRECQVCFSLIAIWTEDRRQTS